MQRTPSQKKGKIPYYKVGAKGRGVRFVLEEVLDALRMPRPDNKKAGEQ